MSVIAASKTQLNLSAVLLNGQSFRWIEQLGNYYGTARGRLWKIRRINNSQIEYRVLASSSEIKSSSEDEAILCDYFNLHVDLEKQYNTWSQADPHIKKLLEDSDEFKGIRILNQEPIECLFAFICSCNNNIKRISKMVNRLCTLYGAKLTTLKNSISEDDDMVLSINPQLLHAFPTVFELQNGLNGMEKQLRDDGFGYRASYIVGSVKLLSENPTCLDKLRYPNSAKEKLLQFKGVGPKVADCIALMSLEHHHICPIDTHVFKCTVKNYRKDLEGKSLTPALHSSIGEFYFEKFGTYAGWAQAIIFNSQLMMGKEVEVKKEKSTMIRKRKRDSIS